MIARFHRAAERELAAAMKVGEERAKGLGTDLLYEVERVVALLCEFPHSACCSMSSGGDSL